MEDFNGRDAYKIVLYSLLKQDESKYNLSVAHREFGAKFLGIPYIIKMKMATYITPNSSFTEGIVDGGIAIKKALRNYDNFANSNTVYKGKKPSEYSEESKAIYNNDEFIDNFGKLFHGTYYVTNKDNKKYL